MTDPTNQDDPERKSSARPDAGRDDSAERLHQMLDSLWQRSKTTIADRVDVLAGARELLSESRLDEPTRLLAVDSAHKLAGVLGTFGLPQGTELALEAEEMFGHASIDGRMIDSRMIGGQVEIERLGVILHRLRVMIDGHSLDRR